MRFVKILPILLFVINAIPCTAARADYIKPGAAECAGINHLMLIYSGDFDVQNWNAADLTPYIFHVDDKGKPDGWFFDGFLFLAQVLDGGQMTEYAPNLKPTDLAGWRWFLDRIFAKEKFLNAMDSAIAASPIGPPPSPRAVVIMIPFPSPKQTDFGDADGDGRNEDFTVKQDRIDAVRAYIDEVLSRWDASGFKHLRLAGFYWMQESFNDDEAEVLKQASAYVHEKGYKMFWIPYYFGNPGTPRWQRKGFDCAAQQPNYFFPRWQAEKTRVATTARMARRFGMGMEMEFDESLMGSDEQYAKYIKYLDTGVSEKYMGGSYVAWYQGSRTLLSLARSADPHLRRLYDLTYDFVKGTYVPSE